MQQEEGLGFVPTCSCVKLWEDTSINNANGANDMTKVQTLAKLLQAADIQVNGTAEWQSHEDGEVTLSDGIYVQVGRGYLIVNKWVDNGEAIRHWPTRKDTQQILSDVREAFAA